MELPNGENAQPILASYYMLDKNGRDSACITEKHSCDVRTRKIDKCREIARLPRVAERQKFMQAGRDLMKLHIAYDKADPYPLLRAEEPNLLQVPTISNTFAIRTKKSGRK